MDRLRAASVGSRRLSTARQPASRFGPLSSLGLAFTILNSWLVLSGSLPLSLISGGPSAAVWGLVVVGAGMLCLSASLAEFLSAYPTAGGQYHWVAHVSPRRYAHFFSWISGWITVFGWATVAASASLLSSQFILRLAFPQNTEERESGNYREFFAYQIATLIAFASNLWLRYYLPFLNKMGLYWSIAGLLVIPVVVLVCASSRLADSSFVFKEFINTTGWPDGIAWILGMLPAGMALNGFDAVSHIIEEVPDPAVLGPKVMVGCVAMGVVTGFYFIVTMLYASGGADEIDHIINSPVGPLPEILYRSTKSRVAGNLLLVFIIACMVAGTVGITTTSSRMLFAFARDGGLPASHIFKRVHERRGIPLNALYLSTAITSCLGLIFLVSTTAFNAICAASVVTLAISYILPIVIHCAQGRQKLPPRHFSLPSRIGWLLNGVGVLYAVVSSILFMFPPTLPVTRETMNYSGVVLALVMTMSMTTWVFHGRHHYRGPPNLDLQPTSHSSSSAADLAQSQPILQGVHN